MSAIFFIIFLNSYNILRLISYFFSIIIISLLIFISPQSKDRIIDLTISQTGITTEKKVLFSESHQKIFRTGWEVFKENKILGAGPNNFKNECKKYLNNRNLYECSSHPHNTYLEILIETGIIGFVFILSLFFFLVYNLIKNLFLKIKKNNEFTFSNFEVALLTCFVISLFPFLPTGSFFNNYLSIIYFLPAGIFLWFKNNKN